MHTLWSQVQSIENLSLAGRDLLQGVKQLIELLRHLKRLKFELPKMTHKNTVELVTEGKPLMRDIKVRKGYSWYWFQDLVILAVSPIVISLMGDSNLFSLPSYEFKIHSSASHSRIWMTSRILAELGSGEVSHNFSAFTVEEGIQGGEYW